MVNSWTQEYKIWRQKTRNISLYCKVQKQFDTFNKLLRRGLRVSHGQTEQPSVSQSNSDVVETRAKQVTHQEMRYPNVTGFYRAALNAGRSSHEKVVRLSVRLSVCLSVCLSNAWILTKRKKKLSRLSAHFEPILARSAAAVTPSEKSVINTNRKSIRVFKWA